jgi:hypothetical protein
MGSSASWALRARNWGGSGSDTVATRWPEEVSRACASHGVVMSVNNSL